jgi:hypothetical protein
MDFLHSHGCNPCCRANDQDASPGSGVIAALLILMECSDAMVIEPNIKSRIRIPIIFYSNYLEELLNKEMQPLTRSVLTTGHPVSDCIIKTTS